MTDPEIQALFAIIRRMRDAGVSVLYVTHRLEEVFQVANSITVLRDGKLVRTCPLAAISRPQLIHMIAGRELRVETRRGDIQPGRPLLRVRELGRQGVFKGISFDVHEEAKWSGFLAGLVGAGRTEIAHAIFAADGIGRRIGEIPWVRNARGQPFLTRFRRESRWFRKPEDARGHCQNDRWRNLVLSSVSRQTGRFPGLIDFRAIKGLNCSAGRAA